MLGTFCPASNTCLTPVGELGLSLSEMKVITGLPVLGEFYEEYVPSEDEFADIRRDSPKFAATLDALFDDHIDQAMSRSKRDVLHTQWLCREIPPTMQGLYSDSSFRHPGDAIEMECLFRAYPYSHSFLAYFLAIWLCRAIFPGRDSNNVKAYSLLPACRLAWGYRIALCPAMVAK